MPSLLVWLQQQKQQEQMLQYISMIPETFGGLTLPPPDALHQPSEKDDYSTTASLSLISLEALSEVDDGTPPEEGREVGEAHMIHPTHHVRDVSL